MFGRRLLVLVAILMGLTALAASLAPPPPQPRGARTGPPPSATNSPPVATSAPSPGQTVSARLSAAPSAVPRRVTAVAGDLVNLVVTGNVVDVVSIPGLAVLEPIAPASPAEVELYADAPGRFPIRLLDAHRRIGMLLIRG